MFARSNDAAPDSDLSDAEVASSPASGADSHHGPNQSQPSSQNRTVGQQQQQQQQKINQSDNSRYGRLDESNLATDEDEDVDEEDDSMLRHGNHQHQRRYHLNDSDDDEEDDHALAIDEPTPAYDTSRFSASEPLTRTESANPHWVSNRKPAQIQTETASTTPSQSSSQMNQISTPRSNLINYQGQIDDLAASDRVNRFDSLTSRNSSIPPRMDVLDDSDHDRDSSSPAAIHTLDRSNILSPQTSTHQYDRLQSNPSIPLSATNPQTSADTSDQTKSSWTNPYWPTYNPSASLLATEKKAVSVSSTASQPTTEEKLARDASPSSLSSTVKASADSDKKEDPWVNPYWQNKTIQQLPSLTPSASSAPSATTTTTTTWTNPYWKDKHTQPKSSSNTKDHGYVNMSSLFTKLPTSPTSVQPTTTKQVDPQGDPDSDKTVPSTTSKLPDQPWENPYWRDKSVSKQDDKQNSVHTKQNQPQNSSTSSKPPTTAWTNPYWKDYPSTTSNQSDRALHTSFSTKPAATSSSTFGQTNQQQNVTSTAKAQTPWINPYWKDSSPQRSSSLTKAGGQTTTSTTKPQTSWSNPYWKDKLSRSSSSPNQNSGQSSKTYGTSNQPQTTTSAAKPQTSWSNSYWKDTPQSSSSSTEADGRTNSTYGQSNQPQTPTSTTKTQTSWSNPYWKGTPSQSSNLSTKPTSQSSSNIYGQENRSQPATKSQTPWINPYWKDNTPQGQSRQQTSAPTSTTQNHQPWINPYWKDNTPHGQSRQQTSAPTNAMQKDQPWTNSYWKDNTPQVQSRQQTSAPTSAMQKDQPWTNSYWKDNTPQVQSRQQTSAPTSATQKGQPWTNPYWKDKTPQTANDANQQQSGKWENPYWKDNKPPTSNRSASADRFPSTPPKQFTQTNYANDDSVLPSGRTSTRETRDANGVVLNNAWKFDNQSPSDHRIPSIPSFYQRVFPPGAPYPSSQTTGSGSMNAGMNNNQSTSFSATSTNKSAAHPGSYEEDPLPFNVDSQGVAHYQSQTSSAPFGSNNRTVNFAEPQPYPKQEPIASSTDNTNSSASTSNLKPAASTFNILNASYAPASSNVTAPFPGSMSKSSALPSMDVLNSLRLSSSILVITEAEIYDIQNALRKLEQNPTSIPLIDAMPVAPPKPPSTSSSNHQYSALNSILTSNIPPPTTQSTPPYNPSFSAPNQPGYSSQTSYNSNPPPQTSNSTPSKPNHILSQFIQPNSSLRI